MNLSETLTPRDRKLLYILLFIVIIFLFGWCLIRPFYNKIVENGEKIEEAASVKSANEVKLIGLTTAETTTHKFEEEYAESTSMYYDIMDSSEIDKLVTSYILGKGLLARDLTISMPEGYVSEEPYLYSDVAEKRAADIAYAEYSAAKRTDTNAVVIADEDEDKSVYFKESIMNFLTGDDTVPMAYVTNPIQEYTSAKNAVTTSESSGIYCAGLQILMEGDEAIEQSVIDELCKNPSVRITGFYWIELDPITYLQEDGTVLIYENDNKQLMLNVNLYMMDRTEE